MSFTDHAKLVHGVQTSIPSSKFWTSCQGLLSANNSQRCSKTYLFLTKACLTDTISTSLLKKRFDVLGPTITSITNFSLHEGSFRSVFAYAIVHVLFKTPSLDSDDLANHRPISSLNFISNGECIRFTSPGLL